MPFDWKGAVSEVIATFSEPTIKKADTTAQKNIVLAFALGIGLIAIFFIFKKGR